MPDSADQWLEFHRDLLASPRVPIEGMTPTDLLLAERDVAELLVALAIQIDRQDVDAIVDLYAPDATVTTALGEATGHEQIRANYVELGSKFERTLHYVGNIVVRVDSATSARIAAFNHTIATKTDGESYTFGGLYEETCVKLGDRWLLKHHHVVDGIAHTFTVLDMDSRFKAPAVPS
jgi:ketosteroid isomerase-like protein